MSQSPFSRGLGLRKNSVWQGRGEHVKYTSKNTERRMRAENEVYTIKPFYRQTLSFELSASAFSFRFFDYL